MESELTCLADGKLTTSIHGEINLPKWKINKTWSDKFLVGMKKILGVCLIDTADATEDEEHNTDLLVLIVKPFRVSCRVRSYQHLITQGRKNEFTVRSSVFSGRETELSKILNGWGDYFLYGFSNKHETELECWTLADLSVFRRWHNGFYNKYGIPPGHIFSNTDRLSSFTVFNWSKLPDNFIVGRNWE